MGGNGQTKQCGECNGLLPRGRTKFCTDTCAVRFRVRRFRLEHPTAESESEAHVKIRRRQIMRDIKREQIAVRKRLRKEATRLRRQLVTEKNRELSQELAVAIAASNAKIAQEFATKIT